MYLARFVEIVPVTRVNPDFQENVSVNSQFRYSVLLKIESQR